VALILVGYPRGALRDFDPGGPKCEWGDLMPDVYSTIKELDTAMQERLADVLETRGADPQQQAMRGAFLTDISFPANSRVLEVGCGTGVLTRRIALLDEVDSVVGVDPAPSLIDRARKLAKDLPNIEFREADGRSLPFEDGGFDVVTFDSTLSHVPFPERALAEALRVLRPGGRLAIFDGDYATTTVALGDHDPLQVCVDQMLDNSVHDRRLMRRLHPLVQGCGFEVDSVRSHGFVEFGGGYMLTIVERGIDFLFAAGHIGEETAAALKAEAQRRIATGTFFGHIAYLSLIAVRPS
jgi:SAM-dependent methyltransferase